MNRKIIVGCFLVIFLMMTTSIVSVAGSEASNEKKESPLYRIRTKSAIRERVDTIVENIKTKFLGERIFLIPMIFERGFLRNFPQQNAIYTYLTDCKCLSVIPVVRTCGYISPKGCLM
jgi:hypothetical protein